MTPMERLLAEEFPDGTFGGARSTASTTPPRRVTTALEAAEHVRVLEAALDQRDGRGTARPRHLTPVPDPLREVA